MHEQRASCIFFPLGNEESHEAKGEILKVSCKLDSTAQSSCLISYNLREQGSDPNIHLKGKKFLTPV